MSADISKMAVIDPRIIQKRPGYAVEKGALSLTNAPFNAIAASTSQITWNVYVPSENVYVDRHILWTSTVSMSMTVTRTGYAPGESIVVPGRDFALCALPLNSLCSTLQATINDTTTVINSQDVLAPLLRFVDRDSNRMYRNCPTMLDTFQNYDDAFGTLANPLGGWDQARDYDQVPNGAHPWLAFTDNAGNVLTGAGDATKVAFAGAAYAVVNGVPVAPPAWDVSVAYGNATNKIVQYNGTAYVATGNTVTGTVPAGAATWTSAGDLTAAVQVYFQWTSTEPVCLSPFIFSDEMEWETGLFGINNIQLLATLVSSPSRVVRQTSRTGRVLGSIAYNTGATSAIANSRLNVQFLTPSLSVPLPPKSCVPYIEYPRYISVPSAGFTAGTAVLQVQSQTITLPSIPDLLIIYAKPSSYGTTEGDWFFPLASINDGVANPLSVNFDNFSGLLSSHTTEQLFDMSRKNGLDMDFASWIGSAHSAGGSYTGRQQGQAVPMVGSILVLKPSQDITLQEGQAPSLVGNFTLQFNLQFKNNTAASATPQLYVITANSGFFESIRGSSRIIKGVLSEQDVIRASSAPAMSRSDLDRMVGGAFSLKTLGNVLGRAHDIYEVTKPLQSVLSPEARRGLEVADKIAHVGSRVGGGRSGGGRSGGGRSGGLAERLM